MKPFGNFNTFPADYTKLANESRFELDRWKEDFHDKLYDNLRVQMEIYLDDETVTFDQYCGFDEAYARGLSSKESNRKERSGNNVNSPKGRIAPQKAQSPATSKATPTDKADKSICLLQVRSERSHRSQVRNCLRNAENKAVDTEKPERGVVTSLCRGELEPMHPSGSPGGRFARRSVIRSTLPRHPRGIGRSCLDTGAGCEILVHDLKPFIKARLKPKILKICKLSGHTT